MSSLVGEIEQVRAVKPLRFVGQASRGSKDKGIPQKKQIELLGEFKVGTYNVLVFYEAVPSEIRTIQRRGRTGRKREGRVVVLVAKGKRDEGYLWAEKRKERLMKETMREFKPGSETLEDNASNDALNVSETSPQPTAYVQ